MSRTRFIAGWVWSGMLAEMLAVGAVSILGAENWIVLLLVAGLEGACLGALQNGVLRRRRAVPGWFVATLCGVVAGRAVQYALESGPWMSAAYRWPHGEQLAAGAAAGLLVGAVIAAFQTVALRGRVRRSPWWIAARAVATALTFVFLGAVQFAVGYPDLPFGALVTMLLAIGAAAGAIETAVEAPCMLFLTAREDRPPQRRSLRAFGASIRTQ